jgi:diguanylate cyclase
MGASAESTTDSARQLVDYDPLEYTESAAETGERLRLALALLGKHRIPPNPVNLTLAYEHVAGRSEALRGRMDEVIAAGAWSGEVAKSLYREFMWDDDKRRLENLREELKRLLNQTSNQMDRSRSEASRSAEVLTEKSERLDQGVGEEDLRRIVHEVVSETRTMASNSQNLKQLLDETRDEVRNLREELLQARREASTDSLTGLANRRAFEDMLRDAMVRSSQSGSDLCLVILDIDHFKRVNDNFGHLMGDRVLRAVAQLISSNVKGKDVVSRFGGEEFAVLLSATGLSDSHRVAENLRVLIARSRIKRMDTGESLDTVTASAGVTVYRRGESTETFIGRADQALYRAKEGGRNQVCLAT